MTWVCDPYHGGRLKIPRIDAIYRAAYIVRRSFTALGAAFAASRAGATDETAPLAKTKWRIASTISDISKRVGQFSKPFRVCGLRQHRYIVECRAERSAAGLWRRRMQRCGPARNSGAIRISGLESTRLARRFRVEIATFHDFVLVIAGVTFRRAHSADQSLAAEGLAFSGSNLSGSRYHSGPADSARWRAQPNVDFPALPPKAAGSPKTDRTEQAP
jgi:hypothetical protein